MNIYKKLPLELRLSIIDIFRKDHSTKLFKEIKNRRHRYICQQLFQTKPNLNNYDNYLENNTLLYYWLNVYNINCDGYPGIFFAKFLERIFPDLDNECNNLNTVFFYYKRKYLGNYEHFIELILRNLENEELEDLYNWIAKNKYKTGLVNYSPLCNINIDKLDDNK